MSFPLRFAATALACASLAAAGSVILAVPAAVPARASRDADHAAPSDADPDGRYGAYLSGSVAAALGDPDAAAQRFAEALADDPTDPGLEGQAFVYAVLAGRPGVPELARGAAGNPLAPLALGNAAAQRGQWGEAQLQYGRDGGNALNQLLRPLLVGWSLQGAGHTDNALATLAAASAGSPAVGLYELAAAMIADLAMRHDEAAGLYAQAAASYPQTDLIAAQAYGSFLARGGRSAQAQALIHRLVGAIPALALAEPGLDSSLQTPPVADALQGLAYSYLMMAALLQQQAPHGAEAEMFMLRFALDLQPGLAPARLLLAELQLGPNTPHPVRPLADRRQDAIATLRAIPPGDPLAPIAQLRLAMLDSSAGHPARAQTLLEHLAASRPASPQPLQALGDVLQDEHEYGAAIKAYDGAIRLMGPLHGDDWPVLFARATAYDRAQDWSAAQLDLQQALRLAPNEPFLLNYLGYSWVERKHALGDARAMIERALDSKPDDGSIRDSLGWAMFRQNDIADAVRELEHAAEQMPEDPTVNYHLGAAYWAAGRHVEARDQWRWALLLHPDKQDAVRIRTALRASNQQGADPLTAADALPISPDE